MLPPGIRSRLTRAIQSAGFAAVFVVMTGASTGCVHNTSRDPNAEADAAGPTTVRVQNQGFQDVVIYVVKSGLRSRLGMVTASSSAVLTIPKTLVQPLTPLQFIASPIAGTRSPISQEITVSPGDEVGLIIPP